ncbi:MAG: PIN domain-containing protein [Rubrobacteraceae bacterium]
MILDTNALFGGKPFTRSESAVLLMLSKTKHIRLVIPDVVLHELSRQWADSIAENNAKIESAFDGSNKIMGEVRIPDFSIELPTVDRSDLHEAATAMLVDRGVEIPAFPEVAVVDLLERDLDRRKPFGKCGKCGKGSTGFRDALIWENVRSICDDLADPAGPVIFVTDNHKDFCAGQDGELHADLQDELPSGQRFEVVKRLNLLLEHEEIKPLADRLHVVSGSLTQQRVTRLVDRALTELGGHELETVGFCAPGDIYDSPIHTKLDDVAFNGVDPDNDTIEFEIFRTGYHDEMTIRVTVDADCDIEGFIDKSTFLVSGSQFTYYEDWNRHRFRAIEQHRVRFTLSADFTESTVDGVALTVDEVEEVTP